MLPGELVWVLEMLGYNWPHADEDKLQEAAAVWRKFGEEVDRLRERGTSSAQRVTGDNSGKEIDAFAEMWRKFDNGGGYLNDAKSAADLMATALEAAAIATVAGKVAIIAQLIALAVEIIAAQAAAPFTFGLSEVGVAAATQATRLIVRKVLDELRKALVQTLLQTLKEPVIQALEAMVSEFVKQGVKMNFGAQQGFDLGAIGGAGVKAAKDSVKDMPNSFGQGLRDSLVSGAAGKAKHHLTGGGEGGHGGGGHSGSDSGGSSGGHGGSDTGGSGHGGGGEHGGGGSGGSGSGHTGSTRPDSSGPGSGSGGDSGGAHSGGSSEGSGGGGSSHTTTSAPTGGGVTGSHTGGNGGAGEHSTNIPRPRPDSGPASDPFGTRVHNSPTPSHTSDGAGSGAGGHSSSAAGPGTQSQPHHGGAGTSVNSAPTGSHPGQGQSHGQEAPQHGGPASHSNGAPAPSHGGQAPGGHAGSSEHGGAAAGHGSDGSSAGGQHQGPSEQPQHGGSADHSAGGPAPSHGGQTSDGHAGGQHQGTGGQSEHGGATGHSGAPATSTGSHQGQGQSHGQEAPQHGGSSEHSGGAATSTGSHQGQGQSHGQEAPQHGGSADHSGGSATPSGSHQGQGQSHGQNPPQRGGSSEHSGGAAGPSHGGQGSEGAPAGGHSGTSGHDGPSQPHGDTGTSTNSAPNASHSGQGRADHNGPAGHGPDHSGGGESAPNHNTSSSTGTSSGDHAGGSHHGDQSGADRPAGHSADRPADRPADSGGDHGGAQNAGPARPSAVPGAFATGPVHASGGSGGFTTGPVRSHDGGGAASQPTHRQGGEHPDGPARTESASAGTMERPTDTGPHTTADAPPASGARQDNSPAATPPSGGMPGGMPHPGGAPAAGAAAPTGTAPSRMPRPTEGGGGPAHSAQPVNTGPVRPSRTPSEGGGSGIPSRPARGTGSGAPGPVRPSRPSADGPSATPHRPDSRTPQPRTSEPRPSDHRVPEQSTPHHQDNGPKAADRTPDHKAPAHAPQGHAPQEHTSQDHAARDHNTPDHNTPDHNTPDHNTPEHHAPAHDHPLSESRPHDTPGGLAPVEPRHQHELESRIPRNPDGTPQRHPDPHGDWPGAINGDGHREPGRNNNCLDVALSSADTYSGHPTAAAPRSHDGSDAGEHGGRDRAEKQLGAPFRDLGNGRQAYHHLEDQLHKSGHGSQAVIITQDAHGRAHAWNAVNHNGKITYLDNQTGARSDHPIHDGKHGVWAIPLDRDRRPIDHQADHHSADHTSHDSRRPADPAGREKRPLDGGEGNDRPAKKVEKEPPAGSSEHEAKHDDGTDHAPKDKGKGKETEHPRHGDPESTDHLDHGVHADAEQKKLRETNPVRSVEMDHVYKQLDRWAEENPQHLAKMLQKTEGPNGQTFKKSELEHALPGFRDMHPGEQGAVVAALGRMSHSFHGQHGVGESPEHRDFPYAESDKAARDGKDSKGGDLPGGAKDGKSRGAVDHSETKADQALKGQKGVRDAIKSGFKTKTVTGAVEKAGPHRPDFTEKNYAVVEVKDKTTGDVHYVVESSVPPSADRKGIRPLHSEPHLGNWIEKLNKEHGTADKRYEVVSLYTEREPCGRGPGHGHCSDYLSTKYGGTPIYYATGYRKGEMPDFPVGEKPAPAPKGADEEAKKAAKEKMDEYDKQKAAYEKAWLKQKKGMDADLRQHVTRVGQAWEKAQKNGLGHGTPAPQPAPAQQPHLPQQQANPQPQPHLPSQPESMDVDSPNTATPMDLDE
ncbi:toxin glutamine deamidase domain-containing protein [Kitasatospora sp. GP82]|uniref:toxin glutamine deamidase domain-containing protein n=1 Tax=Kitasatospora sp. GP82 TaxID=3035089 RepID=UPI0024745F08|nr:toxin glutamine deamidase domain-containing protein [Kitasatospora sp. GP82]